MKRSASGEALAVFEASKSARAPAKSPALNFFSPEASSAFGSAGFAGGAVVPGFVGGCVLGPPVGDIWAEAGTTARPIATASTVATPLDFPRIFIAPELTPRPQ